ncbi:unnamed protein product [Auanema sp. JU1783]|nr:unnamed protein product [Auanema sp. JU1783]
MSLSVLVTGANRGIGLGIVQQFLKNPSIATIFATARNPEKATELKSINDPRLHLIALDVDNDTSITQAFDKVNSVLGEKGLNVLVNNAGLWENYYPNKPANRESFMRSLNVNCVSPLVMIQTFLPLLEKTTNPKVANLSSTLGSLERTTEGSGERGSIAYKTSKAALNMVGRVLAHDFADKNIVVAQFCPGWVRTDMGGQEAQLSVDESTQELANSILTLEKRHSGGFFMRNLKPIPF